MKISTSTSFVVASIALSSSALALPVPRTDPMPSARSPDLSASPRAPHSARVFQESQMAAVARPGKGRPPAIRSGSGGRRSLPRRSKAMLTRDEEDDKSLSDTVNGLLGPLGPVLLPILEPVETALAPLGLGIITAPAKESVGDSDTTSHKPLRFARQIPQFAPANQAANSALAAEQAGEFPPFGFPGGAFGMPGAVQGEISGFVPGYEGPEFVGEPHFPVPNGQPRVPAGFSGIPSQMTGELQTGEPQLPQQVGTVGEAAGQVPSELQNAVGNMPAGGVYSDLPLGLPLSEIQALVGAGFSFSQIESLAGSMGSSVGQTTGNNRVPGGLSNTLGGLTGTLGGVTDPVSGITGSVPVVGGLLSNFGALQGGPPNGESSPGDKPHPSAYAAAPNAFNAAVPPKSESSMAASSSASAFETTATTLPSTSSTDAVDATSTSSSSLDGSMSDSTSTSASDAEPTFAVNVAPDPVNAASSHSLPTGSHSLPVPAAVQSVASAAPSPQVPSPPIINVEAPSPTPSETESESRTGSSSFSEDQSTSSTDSSTTESSDMTTSTSTSSVAAAEPTSSSTVDPVERRMLLSRIMRYFRREDAPLPKGFTAPTGPIPNDTPPLLEPTVRFPAGKVKRDQMSSMDADATIATSVTSTAASESSQTESSLRSEESESSNMDSSETSSSESSVAHAESTSIASA